MKEITISFSEKAIRIIKKIPRGKVATYGQIAALAGNPLGARQVVRLLHSSSDKHNLPWQRVINSQGKIALPRKKGYETQKRLLRREGVKFRGDRIDLDEYQWNPRRRF